MKKRSQASTLYRESASCHSPPTPPKAQSQSYYLGVGVSRKASPVNQQQRGPPQHPHLSLSPVTLQTASPRQGVRARER